MKKLRIHQVVFFILLLAFLIPGYLNICQAQYFTKVTNVITTDSVNARSVNWIDYDNDNDLDLYISNGANPPINALLYENIGNGDFIKHPEAAVCTNTTSADGSSWADYNNDGNLDLYIVAWWGQRSYLYDNLGNGDFQEVTEGTLGNVTGYSESCAWGDYDNDGFVDLYVANSGAAGSVLNYFYHNDCGNSFTRIPDGSPATDKATSRTVNWVDYDNDGDLDLFISNETGEQNNLYRNMLLETGRTGFESVTDDPVVQDENNSISSCWGDYDNDGDFDLFVANNGQNNELFQNNGTGTFTKITEGIQSNDAGCSFGCNWVDYDNDGDLDMFVTNGWCSGDQNDFLYRNLLMETDTATFEKVTDTLVTGDGEWSYGSSWGDYDRDGDLDLLVAKCHDDARIIHNSLFRNESDNGWNWITIKCVGRITNASAIGTKVLVKAVINDKPVWQLNQVSSQQSYCSENLFLHFGLGNASQIDSIIVKWPSGINQYLTNADTNQFLEIIEDTLLFAGDRPTCRTYTAVETVISEEGNSLFEFYPNPATGNVSIMYHITTPGKVTMRIYDMKGNEVRSMRDTYFLPGNYTRQIDMSNLSKGMYMICMTLADYTESKKVLLTE
jgi:enediyne biosynthesis protein E4